MAGDKYTMIDLLKSDLASGQAGKMGAVIGEICQITSIGQRTEWGKPFQLRVEFGDGFMLDIKIAPRIFFDDRELVRHAGYIQEVRRRYLGSRSIR